MVANLKFGPMLITNFGPFEGKHVFNWDRGPSLLYVAGKNLREPALGANGAGKTTLLVALFWCCTGQTLRNSRPGERVEPWHGKGTTSVRLGFIRDGVKHDLYRSRKPNKLTLNDKVVTDDEVRRLLPDSDVMLYSFLLGQTNTLFLDLKPEPQSQLFTDLLELDVWLTAAERAGSAAADAGKEAEKFDREIASLEGRIGELQSGLEELQVGEQEYESVTNRQLAAFDSEIAALRKDAKTAATALTKLGPGQDDAAIKDLEQRQGAAAGAVRGWRQKAAATRGTLQATTREVEDLSAELTQMLKTEQCPTCGTALIKTDYNALKKRLEKKVADTLTQLENAREKEVEASEELAGWEKDLDELSQQLGAARATARERQQKHSEASRHAATLSAELAAKEAERQRLYDSENPYTLQLAGRRERIANLTGDLTGLAGEKTEIEAVRDIAKLWQEGFRAIRLSIIDDTLTEVALAANRHAERLGLSGWQIEFATERETKKGTTSLGFTTFLYPPTMDRPIPWDSYSGGESQRLQLAVSFGLGEVLLARAGISPNIECLDEPTDGLSAEGINDLLECLAERARETGRTIWVIDHNSLEKGSFDGTILVEKNEDGSRILEA